jgi:plasmid stabilization system protein ParE
MKVIVTQRAKNDLLELFDYNAKISLNYAIRVDKKIRSYIENLQFSPYIGRYVSEIPDKHYRERICEKFRIIYFISEKSNIIFIRYIFNSRQDKNTFFKLHQKEIYNFFNQLFI